MRVAVFNGSGQPITIERLPQPQPGGGEVLIEIGRCGISGSDIAMTSGSPFDYAPGCRLGHEYAGEVVELGAGVSTLRIGDLVAVMPKAGCGHCASCQAGRPLFCPTGPMLFGGFGDCIVVPETAVYSLPSSLSLGDGALVEPMACGLRALHLAGMRGGERILVLGAGAMALSVIFWARRLGAATITVASRSGRRREITMAMGADAFHDYSMDDPKELSATIGGPPDIVAECIGQPGMLDRAVDLVRISGTVLSMGMCVNPDPLVPARCAFKEVRMIFPVAYSVSEFEQTLREFDAATVRPEAMVSQIIDMKSLPNMVETLRGGHPHLKVHIDPRLDNEPEPESKNV